MCPRRLTKALLLAYTRYRHCHRRLSTFCGTMEHSADPDRTPHDAASEQSIHCMLTKCFIKRGSCMVWEINMGVCPRLDFDNIMLFNCLGYNFNIYGAFEFLCNSIANL